MAREVSRELSGRLIRKDQLERLVEAVEREFPSSSERKFSIAGEDSVYKDTSFDNLMKAAGKPALVDNLTISDKDSDKTFVFEADRGLFKIKAEGGHHFYPAGIRDEVERILNEETSRLRKHLPASIRRILSWCMPIEAILTVAAVLSTAFVVGWVVPVSSACIGLALFLGTWKVRCHFTTCLLLKDDAKVPWTRENRLTVAAMSVPIIVALIVNLPNWTKDEGTPATPKSGATGKSADPKATASRGAASGSSRDTTRSSLTKIMVKPAVGRAGEPFVLSGKGFEPNAEVWVTLEAGKGVTLPKEQTERHLVRANEQGEIAAEKIMIGQGVCCTAGTIRVVAVPQGKTATVETMYKLK